MILAIDQGTTGSTSLVFDPRASSSAAPTASSPSRAAARERARFEPRMSEDERGTLLAGWRRAVERSSGWAREL